MTLNLELLQKAVRDLNDKQGITYSEITAASGVHNVGRIKSGEIEPKINTWLKLHQAYPDTVPAPEYIKNGEIYASAITQSGGGNQAGRVVMVTNSPLMTVEQEMLIKLLNEKDSDGKICRKFISDLI